MALFAALVCTLLAAAHSGDLVSHHLSKAVDKWETELVDTAPVRPTLVTAAQGRFQGPKVLEVLFKTSNFPALTGINLAVGIITLGGDGKGGCGVVPFHNHPNCYEVMTTLSGKGGYGQIRPDGSVLHSRVLRKGAVWVMEQGAQHYYRNLDPDSEWTFEIAFTCSEVAAESSWKWIGHLDTQLVQQFWQVSEAAAIDLTKKDDTLVKSSTRFIANCAADESLHSGPQADNEVYMDRPTHDPPDQGSGGKVSFYTMPTPSSKNGTAVGLSIARMRLEAGGMQNPAVCYNGHAVVHVLTGEVLIAQWTYDNKMAVEILHRHDLLLIPRGAVHFIINLQQSEAELYIHYDTPGKTPESKDYEPQIAVLSNFFAFEKATLLEAVLQCSKTAAEELAAASSQNKLFAIWTGDMAGLREWAAAHPQYCPLGCQTISTQGENVDQTIRNVPEMSMSQQKWEAFPETPLMSSQMTYLTYLSMVANVFLLSVGSCYCA